MKLTFTGFGKKTMLTKSAQDFANMFAMGLGVVRIDKKIVKIDNDADI